MKLCPLVALLLTFFILSCKKESANYISNIEKISRRKYDSFFVHQNKSRFAYVSWSSDIEKEFHDSLHILFYNMAVYGDEVQKRGALSYLKYHEPFDERWYVDFLHSNFKPLRILAKNRLIAEADTSVSKYLIPLLDSPNNTTANEAAELLTYFIDTNAVDALYRNRNRLSMDALKFYGDQGAERLLRGVEAGDTVSAASLAAHVNNVSMKVYILNNMYTLDFNELGTQLFLNGDSVSVNLLAETDSLQRYLRGYSEYYETHCPIQLTNLFSLSDEYLKAELAETIVPTKKLRYFWGSLREEFKSTEKSGKLDFAHAVIEKESFGIFIDSIEQDHETYQLSPLATVKALKTVQSPGKYLLLKKYIAQSDELIQEAILRAVEKDNSPEALDIYRAFLTHHIAEKDMMQVRNGLKSLSTLESETAAPLLLELLQKRETGDFLNKLHGTPIQLILAKSGMKESIPYLLSIFNFSNHDRFSEVINMKQIDDERLIDPAVSLLQAIKNNSEKTKYKREQEYAFSHCLKLLSGINSEKAKMAMLPFIGVQREYQVIASLKGDYSEENRRQIAAWALNNRDDERLFREAMKVLPHIMGKDQLSFAERILSDEMIDEEFKALYLGNCNFNSKETKLFEYVNRFKRVDNFEKAIGYLVKSDGCDPFVMATAIKESPVDSVTFDHFLKPPADSAARAFNRDIILKMDSAGYIGYEEKNNLAYRVIWYVEKNYEAALSELVKKYARCGDSWKRDQNVWHPLLKKEKKNSFNFKEPVIEDRVGLRDSEETKEHTRLLPIYRIENPDTWVETALKLAISTPYTSRQVDIEIIKHLESAKEQLLQCVQHENWKIRLKAAYFLAVLNDEDSRRELRILSNDPVPAVAKKAEWFLRSQRVPFKPVDPNSQSHISVNTPLYRRAGGAIIQ